LAEQNLLVSTDIGRENAIAPSHEATTLSRWNIDAAAAAGKFLAWQHSAFRGEQTFITGDRSLDLRKWLWELELRTTVLIGALPSRSEQSTDLAERVSSRTRQLAETHVVQTLVNPDVCPKNVYLYDDRTIGVVDFEFCSGLGDPIYDVGFLVGHLLICGLLHPQESTIRMVDACLDAYAARCSIEHRMNDVAWYAACTVLYRDSGASCLAALGQSAKHASLLSWARGILDHNGGDFEEL
jgi:Ser/Thr protein kinase RdoA (MazF antagonist)